MDAAVRQGSNEIAGAVPDPIKSAPDSGAGSVSAETAALNQQRAALEAQNAARANSAVITGPQINPTNPAIIKQFELLKDFQYPAGRQQSNRKKLAEDSATRPSLQRLGHGIIALKNAAKATHSWINLGAKPAPLRFTNEFLLQSYITAERYCGLFTRKGPKQEFGYGIDKFEIPTKVKAVYHFDISEKVRVFASLENSGSDTLKVDILGVGYHTGGNTVSYFPFKYLTK